MYGPRFYRSWMNSEDLVNYEVKFKETDIMVGTQMDLREKAREAVLTCRRELEGYLRVDPGFKDALRPYEILPDAPLIVKEMAEAGRKAGVGPMAAVAGAIAEFVGERLSLWSKEVVVENGGDIYLRGDKPRKVGVYAGESPWSERLIVSLHPRGAPLGICTSSGTVGHSLSFGEADAVVILSSQPPLADAVATAVGNLVISEKDLPRGLDLAKSIEGIKGALIIKGEELGVWGEMEIEVRGR